jgi:vacuolar protein sorting-associated protein 13D
VCTRQSLKILGTIDFLGNPLALIQDVTDGVACLRNQHSVAGLVKNVAHGVANSTSKVTGSISHGLGKLVSDSEHDNRRQATTDNNRNATVGHVIRHGAAGVAAGFRDGVTSIFKQPMKGAAEDGVHGLVKGFVKGIVGTVSKPTVGILDFTNDVAIAIKDSARSPNTTLHNRIRLTRCSSNILGLLQPYSTFDAHGHYLLYKMNKGNLHERYITRIILSTTQMNTSDKRIVATTSQSNKSTSNKRGDCVNVSSMLFIISVEH